MVIMMIQHEMFWDSTASGSCSVSSNYCNSLLGLKAVSATRNWRSGDIRSMWVLRVILMISAMFNSQWMISAEHTPSAADASHAWAACVVGWLCSRGGISDFFAKLSRLQGHLREAKAWRTNAGRAVSMRACVSTGEAMGISCGEMRWDRSSWNTESLVRCLLSVIVFFVGRKGRAVSRCVSEAAARTWGRHILNIITVSLTIT